MGGFFVPALPAVESISPTLPATTMCYSAMIEESYREYCRTFNVQLDWDEWLRLFHAREKDLSLKIPDGTAEQLIAFGGNEAMEIRRSQVAYRELDALRIKLELQTVEDALREIEARKPGKTRDKDLGVKNRKREKLLAALNPPSYDSGAVRIYPYQFAPVIRIGADGRRLLSPMRYRVLPRTGVEVPPKYNVFNARRDSLMGPDAARTWRPLFGSLHALFPFTRFYEWVERDSGKVEITFNPDGYENMWSAALYEETPVEWGVLRSFAMVTDEPPPEVAAAGHDRCPVFLRSDLIDQWLRPAGQSLEQLDALLDHTQPTHYSHALAA